MGVDLWLQIMGLMIVATLMICAIIQEVKK